MEKDAHNNKEEASISLDARAKTRAGALKQKASFDSSFLCSLLEASGVFSSLSL
jgi:hypothetical protein